MVQAFLTAFEYIAFPVVSVILFAKIVQTIFGIKKKTNEKNHDDSV